MTDDDWFQRCDAVYQPTDDRQPERCAFPALDSPEWYMHGDWHESRTWNWGSDGVRLAQEERRAEA